MSAQMIQTQTTIVAQNIIGILDETLANFENLKQIMYTESDDIIKIYDQTQRVSIQTRLDAVYNFMYHACIDMRSTDRVRPIDEGELYYIQNDKQNDTSIVSPTNTPPNTPIIQSVAKEDLKEDLKEEEPWVPLRGRSWGSETDDSDCEPISLLPSKEDAPKYESYAITSALMIKASICAFDRNCKLGDECRNIHSKDSKIRTDEKNYCTRMEIVDMQKDPYPTQQCRYTNKQVCYTKESTCAFIHNELDSKDVGWSYTIKCPYDHRHNKREIWECNQVHNDNGRPLRLVSKDQQAEHKAFFAAKGITVHYCEKPSDIPPQFINGYNGSKKKQRKPQNRNHRHNREY